jgi:hypothetical protein
MPIEKIDKSSAPIITKSVTSANDPETFLSDLSPSDKHRRNVDRAIKEGSQPMSLITEDPEILHERDGSSSRSGLVD